MTYSVAVLGLGVMGQRMLGHLALHEQFEILGGWDASAEARAHAKTLHPTVDFDTPAEALIASDKADLVYIGVPPLAHAGYALAAIDAKKAVLCEKPLGVDVADSRSLTERMEASGLPQAINFAYGSSRAGDVIRDAYDSGEFGTLLGVDIRQHFAVWPRPWQAQAKWLALKEEGGFVREVLSHFLYLCDRVLGPATLESFDVRHPADPTLCETHASARLTAKDVPISVASSAGGVGPDLVEITFWGTRKSHRITDWYRTEETTGGPWVETTPTVDDFRRDGAFRQLNQIAAMIEGKPHSLPDFRAALRVQELIEAILGVTRQVRAFLVVVALILVGTVSSYLTHFYDQLPNDTRPLPALVNGLPTVNATARLEFAKRVSERFPIGSNERSLMLELWAEGFDHPGEGQGPRRWASLERRDVACITTWTVTWATDDAGHLTAVEGTYIPSCS